MRRSGGRWCAVMGKKRREWNDPLKLMMKDVIHKRETNSQMLMPSSHTQTTLKLQEHSPSKMKGHV